MDLEENVLTLILYLSYENIQDQIESMYELVVTIHPEIESKFRCLSYSPRKWQKYTGDTVNPWKFVEQIVIQKYIKEQILPVVLNKIKIIQNYYMLEYERTLDDSYQDYAFYLVNLYNNVRSSNKYMNRLIHEFAEKVYVESQQ